MDWFGASRVLAILVIVCILACPYVRPSFSRTVSLTSPTVGPSPSCSFERLERLLLSIPGGSSENAAFSILCPPISGSYGAERMLAPLEFSSGGSVIFGAMVFCLPLIMLSLTLICSLSLS